MLMIITQIMFRVRVVVTIRVIVIPEREWPLLSALFVTINNDHHEQSNRQQHDWYQIGMTPALRRRIDRFIEYQQNGIRYIYRYIYRYTYICIY